MAGEEGSFRPDATIQKQLAILMDSVPDRALFHQQIDKLRKISEKTGKRTILLQSVWFGSRGKDVKEAMAKYLVIRHLDISTEEVLDALIPYLDTTDVAIKKEIVKLLQRAENWHEDMPVPDFTCYERYIQDAIKKKQDPSHALLEHIYDSSPGRAFLLMLKVYTQEIEHEKVKPLLWAEHVVAEMFWKRDNGFLEPKQSDPEAIRQLEYLAERKEWWARLYVAEIVRKNTELLTEKIRKSLKKERHLLVQKRWKVIK